MEAGMVTTGFDLVGYRVSKNLGVVRGITVRSRSALGKHCRERAGVLRRQHHHLHRTVRARALGSLRPDAGARGADGRERGDRHALRRERRDGGHHRGAGVRDSRGGAKGVGVNKRTAVCYEASSGLIVRMDCSAAWRMSGLGSISALHPAGVVHLAQHGDHAGEIGVSRAGRPAIRIGDVDMEEPRAARGQARLHVRLFDVRVERVEQDAEVVRRRPPRSASSASATWFTRSVS